MKLNFLNRTYKILVLIFLFVIFLFLGRGISKAFHNTQVLWWENNVPLIMPYDFLTAEGTTGGIKVSWGTNSVPSYVTAMWPWANGQYLLISRTPAYPCNDISFTDVTGFPRLAGAFIMGNSCYRWVSRNSSLSNTPAAYSNFVIDTSVLPGQTYTYGINSTGYSFADYIVWFSPRLYGLAWGFDAWVSNAMPYYGSASATYNPTPPPRFTSISASSACSGSNPYVQVSWQASNSNGTYYIYRNGSYVTSFFGGAGRSYFDYGVTDASSYTYTLYTYGPGGGPAVANTYTSTPLCKPPPTINLYLGKNPITYGESTYLYWNVYNASWMTSNFGATGQNFSNATPVAPGSTTTYRVWAYDQWGRSAYNQITLNVKYPPPSITFYASPSTINRGNYTYLYWTVTNAQQFWTSWGGYNYNSWSSPYTFSNAAQVAPSQTTTYSIWVYGRDSQWYPASTTVTVNIPQASCTLTANPSTVLHNSPVTLTWSSQNATSVSSSNFGAGAVSGSTTVLPSPPSTTYNLTVNNSSNNPGSCSTTVNVKPRLFVAPSSWTINLAQGSNASQTFTISTSYGNYPWTISSNQPWLSFDKTSGTTPSSFTATANVSSFSLGTYTTDITVTAPDAGNSPVTIPVTINIVKVSKVTGDIFAKGAITGLEIDPNSVVVSASGQINVSGTTYTIPNYTFATALNWNIAKAQMEQNVNRLKSTKAKTYKPQGTDDVLIDGAAKPAFNLNPDPNFGSDPFANPNIDPGSPDGGVFLVKGNLTLRNTTFKAKGTIIVEKNLTIEGDVQYDSAYPSSSLGIIALGDINVRPTVNNLIGAYYTLGSLTLESDSSNLFNFKGLLIGGTALNLNRESFAITYDPRIVSLTPPGFSQYYLPTFREATP